MNKFEINPLNVLDKRLLEVMPPHFTKIKIKTGTADYLLVRWIYFNLKGRFSIYSETEKHFDKTIKRHVFNTYSTVGFEDPKELTLTLLKCPYVKERKK